MSFLGELEARYRSLDDGDLALLKRDDLTAEARAIYDNEVMKRNMDEHLGKIYRSMDDGEFKGVKREALTPSAKILYDGELRRRESSEKMQSKKEPVIVNVGYAKWNGALFLSAALLNVIGHFTTVGPYPPLRMFLMAIFAVMGVCYLTRTAYSVDIANKTIIFYSLMGPLKRMVKYARLEVEGDKIYYIDEKDGKKKKLTYLGVNKKDARILRERISNTENGKQ